MIPLLKGSSNLEAGISTFINGFIGSNGSKTIALKKLDNHIGAFHNNLLLNGRN